jgi:hypothetical protein
LGDIILREGASLASPDHRHIDDPIAEANIIDIPAIALQERADLVDDLVYQFYGRFIFHSDAYFSLLAPHFN